MKQFSALVVVLLITGHIFSQTCTDTAYKSLANFGAVGNGTTNDAAAVQNFINFCAAHRVTGLVPDGCYLINSALKLQSNLKLVFSKNAKFLRGFNGTDGAAGSFIQQTDFSTPLSNITLEGFHYAVRPDTTIIGTGRVMSLRCNDLILKDMQVDSFNTSICLFLAGDRIHIESPIIRKTNGITGEGGIRLVGGSDFICSNAYVESGDDCFQFVPAANPSDPFFNLPISNGTYINCKGISYAARLIVAANEENNSSRVQNCYFINVTGAGNGTSPQCINLSDQSCSPDSIISASRDATGLTTITVKDVTNRGFPWFNKGDTIMVTGNANFNGTFIISDTLSDKIFTYTDSNRTDINTAYNLKAQRIDGDRISNITIRDVTARDTATGSNAILVDHVKNLMLDNITLSNVTNRALFIQDASTNIYLDGFNAAKATSSGSPAIEIDSSSKVYINNANVYANGTSAILVGSGIGLKCTNINIANSKLYNIADNFYGINFNNCSLLTATNNYIEKAVGSTNSKGIKTSVNAVLGKIENNSFDNVDVPTSDGDTTNSNVYAFNTPLGKPTDTTGAGIGTGGTATISSTANDVAGQITLNLGTSPTGGSTIATLFFNSKRGSKPKAVILSPANQGAAGAIAKYFVDNTTLSNTAFTIKNVTGTITGSVTYIINYKIEW